MAGGGGTRFWPLSRRELPKQFLNLTGRDVLVNETFDRLQAITASDHIYVITNSLYAEKTLAIMGDRINKERVLTEPASRNTAACIGYAAMKILKKHGDGIMCVMPADHYIEREEEYAEVIRKGIRIAEETDRLVTIGIRPTYPATGYGYIKSRQGTDESCFLVEEFVEKPPLEIAKRYLANGGYTWNSGMYVWKASLILNYFQNLLPDIYECLQQIGEAMNTPREMEVLKEVYPRIPKISVDYGIMERADNVVMLEGDFGWNDIGSLDAMEILHGKDDRGNVKIGQSVLVDADRTICYAKERLVVAAYVQDLMVVDTEDAVLICPKEKAQEVKKIVDILEAEGRTDRL